jgi:TM2 domain-containing membrane protein YozV
MVNILHLMPSLEFDEMSYVQALVKDFSDEQIKNFATIYNSRRKDPQTILLLTLVGFLGVAGVQRFVLDQVGMGLLYLFTGGLCVIGTIVDLVNHKNLTFEFNQKIARQVAGMVAA